MARELCAVDTHIGQDADGLDVKEFANILTGPE